MFRRLLKRIFATMVFVFAFLAAMPWLIPINHKALPAGFHPYPNSQYCNIDGVRLHYRVDEPKGESRGNILFVHGFSGSTFCWRYNTDTLVTLGYRVVCVDVPAFGYSDKSAGINHSTTANAQLLWHLADSLGKGEPWNLIGHSMGGGIVGAMGAIRPQQAHSIVFVDGVFSSASTHRPFPQKVLNSVISSVWVKRWAEVIGKYKFYNYKSFEKLLKSAYARDPDSAAVEGYLAPFRVPNSAASIMEMTSGRETVDADDKQLTMPMLVIWGDKDTWIDISTGKTFAQKHQVDSLVVLKGAGHCSMETNAGEFNREVVLFLERHR